MSRRWQPVFSPNGATVNSQGREPLETTHPMTISPNGAAVPLLTKLLSLRWSLAARRLVHQGLTPLAINFRRVAAYVRPPILFLLILLLLLASSPRGAHASGEFPYIAYVIEPESYVRSGPGNQHYPTGQLPAGYAVEVYRHDDGGWCAIRPPEGSFSLAPAHQLRILDSRTAEVTGTGVVARVGSALGEQRNAVQVLLERGEAVQLVEQPTPGQPWVKIAPPAGEFRWIASRRLSRTPPMESPGRHPENRRWQSRAMSESAEDSPAGADAFSHLNAPNAGSSNSPSSEAYPARPGPKDASSNVAAPMVQAADSEQIQVVAGSPAEVVLAQHQEPVTPTSGLPLSDASKSGQPRIRFPGSGSTATPSGPVHPRVGEMQLRLSQIVVQPPASWQLAGLREETAALLANEQSPQIRDQLRDLLERIATFETVQNRYRNPGSIAPAPATAAIANAAPGQAPTAAPKEGMTGQTSEVLARVRSDLGVDNTITPTPGGPGPPSATAATEALYDAVGTLKPVVSRREQAPRYALVDDHGDVVTFVTASADVNLQPYVGKRIGVRGNRGFMPEYRRAHVTASRVTPLEEKLVR
jgi:hypothetical protein